MGTRSRLQKRGDLNMTDKYQFWRDALAGKKVEVHDGHPEPGFYKMRRGKDQPWLPVAIWWDDATGTLIGRVGDTQVEPKDIWLSAAKNPVAQDAAKHAFQHGTWPGDVPDAPPIGHNAPPTTLEDQISDVSHQALTWLERNGISDPASSDKAANYREQLLDLKKKADAERVKEKRPHDDAAKAVQQKWKPVIEAAETAAGVLRDALTTWMRAEEARQRREAEEFMRRVREEEARKRQQLLEEQKAKGVPDEEAQAVIEDTAPEVPGEAPKPRVQAGGQRGRKTGLRTIKTAVIKDYDKALAHFAHHDKVRAVIEQLTNHAARDGHAVPGVEVREDKVAA